MTTTHGWLINAKKDDGIVESERPPTQNKCDGTASDACASCLIYSKSVRENVAYLCIRQT